MAKVALRFGCAKQSKNLEWYLMKTTQFLFHLPSLLCSSSDFKVYFKNVQLIIPGNFVHETVTNVQVGFLHQGQKLSLRMYAGEIEAALKDKTFLNGILKDIACVAK